MGLLYYTLLVAAAQRERSYRGGSRRSSSRESSSRRSDDYGGGRINYPISYYTCIADDVLNDEPIIAPFFKMLYERAKLEKEKELESLKQKRKELKEKIETISPRLKQFNDLKESAGLHATYEYIGRRVVVSFPHLYRYIDTIDGENITELFDQAKKDLEEYKQKKQENEKKIVEFSLKVKEAEKSAKRAIFKRKEKFKKVEELKEELEFENYKKHSYGYDEKIIALEKLLAMSDSEKTLFAEGLKELCAGIELTRELDSTKHEIVLVESDYREEQMFSRALEGLSKEGSVTETSLERLFLAMDKAEIRQRRGEYQIGSETSYSPRDKYKPIVKWFVKKVYEADEDFVKRNYEPQDEKIEKTKTLKK